MLRLPDLVGSPLSVNALRENLRVSHAWQISAVGTKDYLGAGGIRVTPALTLLGTLI